MKMRWIALIALIAFGFWLFSPPGFSSVARPAASYDGALKRFAEIEAAEASLPLAPEGKSRLFTHGHKTGRVFVLLHGLTNCPEQFVPLAKILFASGANVVIPRARYAGFADRMNDVQGLQSGQDLLDQAAEGLDIAAGLGDRISLAGLSGSAVAAAWMAEHREGIESVLVMSPFFSLYGYPVPVIDALSAVLSKAPNFYMWWNNALQEKNPGPSYAYPRYGTRCMADTVQLSRAVRSSSGPLKAGRMDILTTGTDVGANNALTGELASEWADKNPARVTAFQFPATDGVPHDMVDPNQPDAKIGLTYPVILERLGVSPAAGTQKTEEAGE